MRCESCAGTSTVSALEVRGLGEATARRTKARVRERTTDVTDDSVRIERELLDRHAMNLLIAASLPRDGHAIDIGAHRGGVLREILRVAPLGRHVAYEPLPDCYKYLRREFRQVDVRNVALSDTNGTTSFLHVVAAPEFSGMRQRAYPGYEDSPRRKLTVPMQRLDDDLPDGCVPR